MPAKKFKLPVRRKSLRVVHEDDAHLWAISYADLLMVLMSFFIIFFTIDQPQKSILQRLKISGLQNSGIQSSGMQASGKQTSSDLKSRQIAEVDTDFSGLDSMANSLRHLDVKVEKSKDKIILDFPDNVFKSGEFESDAVSSDLLLKTLNELLVYKDEISLVFIGHSDESPLKNKKQRFVRNNFELSALRGLRALQYAVDHGFSSDQVSAQGVASHDRNSRTLSVQISMKDKFK